MHPPPLECKSCRRASPSRQELDPTKDLRICQKIFPELDEYESWWWARAIGQRKGHFLACDPPRFVEEQPIWCPETTRSKHRQM